MRRVHPRGQEWQPGAQGGDWGKDSGETGRGWTRADTEGMGEGGILELFRDEKVRVSH